MPSPVLNSKYKSINNEPKSKVNEKRKANVENTVSKKSNILENLKEEDNVRPSPHLNEIFSQEDCKRNDLNSSFEAFNFMLDRTIINKLSNDSVYLSMFGQENDGPSLSCIKSKSQDVEAVLKRSRYSSHSVLSTDSEFNSQESQNLANRLQRKIFETSENLSDLNYGKNFSQKEILQMHKTQHESTLNSKDVGPFWGLSSYVKSLIEKIKGITELYDWQKQCLTEGIKGNNLLVSLPTSGGKTLVAEILMLRKILLFKRDVILILPYVTLVQEKVRGLSLFAVDLNFLVEEYAGSKGIFPPPKRRRNTMYVATIEKASTLIDYLIEGDKMTKIGLVVVDEVHMLGETGGRGAKLECLIIKMKFVTKDIQIVGMSATVGNLSELANFLNANLFCGSFRPVPLKEYVKVADKIGEVDQKAKSEKELYRNFRINNYPTSKHQQKLDPDSITNLVEEIIPSHSCLVFCATKNSTECIAKLVASCLSKSHLGHKTIEKRALLRALKGESDGNLCPIFRQIVPYGISYHHSGLTEGERKLIEEGYIQGTLCCICCTSTLAAGVNLPARRVIIRAPYIGKDFLTRTRYQQMVGRAGRAGLDSMGESYLIVAFKDLHKVSSLLLSPIENCVSRLEENNGHGLTELLFSLIWLGLILTYEDAVECVKYSLLYLQQQQLNVQVEDLIYQLIEGHKERGFLKILNTETKTSDFFDGANSTTKTPDFFDSASSEVKPPESSDDASCRYGLSQLGKAAIKGGIDITIAKTLYADLIKSLKNVTLNCQLHLLYLVTPYAATKELYFKEAVFCELYEKLNDEEKEVAKLLGITDAVIIMLMKGLLTQTVSREVVHRFHVTMAIDRVMKGDSVMMVSQQFEVHRGVVQRSMLSAASFASSVYIFCQELKELWAFEALLSKFSKRVAAHSRAELIPLLELPSVKLGRAKVLYNAGFSTLVDVANADPAKLVSCIDHLSYKVAYQIITSAKMLLLQKAESLQDEAAEMLLSLCKPS